MLFFNGLRDLKDTIIHRKHDKDIHDNNIIAHTKTPAH